MKGLAALANEYLGVLLNKEKIGTGLNWPKKKRNMQHDAAADALVEVIILLEGVAHSNLQDGVLGFDAEWVTHGNIREKVSLIQL